MTTRSPDSTPNHFIHPKSQAQFRELAATTEQVRKIRSNIASHCSKCRRGSENEKDMQRCARVCNRLLFLHLTYDAYGWKIWAVQNGSILFAWGESQSVRWSTGSFLTIDNSARKQTGMCAAFILSLGTTSPFPIRSFHKKFCTQNSTSTSKLVSTLVANPFINLYLQIALACAFQLDKNWNTS